MRSTICIAGLLGVLCATPAWGKTYMDVSVGGGVGDQVLDAHGDLTARWNFDAVSIWRMAVGGGIESTSGFEVGSELAWSQRGGSLTFLGGSIFQPLPRVIEIERSYLDVSIGVRQGLKLSSVAVSIAIAPRLSVLLQETPHLYRDRDPRSRGLWRRS